MATTNGDVAPVQQVKINTDIVTLTRFLTEEQTKHKEATGDFTWVAFSILAFFSATPLNRLSPILYPFVSRTLFLTSPYSSPHASSSTPSPPFVILSHLLQDTWVPLLTTPPI